MILDKFNKFYAELSENESLRAEVEKILGENTFDNAGDEQLLKIGDIARNIGLEFDLDEVKAYFADSELDDEALDSVAGGKGFFRFKKDYTKNVSCPSGSTVIIEL